MKKRAPGCLGYIGDETVPCYVGIIISHYKDPYQTTSKRFFFRGSSGCLILIHFAFATSLTVDGQLPTTISGSSVFFCVVHVFFSSPLSYRLFISFL